MKDRNTSLGINKFAIFNERLRARQEKKNSQTEEEKERKKKKTNADTDTVPFLDKTR